MKKLILITSSLFSAIFLLIASNNCQAQSIVNGDFELWPTENCPYNVAPNGWTNFSTNLGPDQAGTCAGSVVSFQGNSHMNLVWYTGFSVIEGASQELTGLVSGQLYQIAFQAINDRGLYSGSDDVFVDFYLDSAVIFSTPTLVYGGEWTPYSVSFIASSSSHTIAFKVNAASGVNNGSAGIDAVMLDLTTSLDTYSNDNAFHVFPNPASGQFTISLPDDEAEITISDVLGKKIFETTSIQNTLTLQLTTNGVYTVCVKTKHGILTRKLIVNNE